MMKKWIEISKRFSFLLVYDELLAQDVKLAGMAIKVASSYFCAMEELSASMCTIAIYGSRKDALLKGASSGLRNLLEKIFQHPAEMFPTPDKCKWDQQNNKSVAMK